MRKFILFNLLIISFMSLTLGMDENSSSKKLTHISARYKVLECHLTQPDKDDSSIFGPMRQWHEEDFAALDHVVTCSENKNKLQVVHSLLTESFEAKTVTHSKIAAAYYLYSVIISLKSEQGNAVDAETDENFGRLLQQVEPYIKTGVGPYEVGDTMWILFSRDKHGLRWVPFVSKTALASYRTQNNLFGEKAPHMGVPLGRSSWDGYLDSTPAEFAHHELRHGALQDSDKIDAIEPSYAIYHQLNYVVRGIKDPSHRSLCDFFLAELGHEHISGIRRVWGSDNLLRPTLEEACDEHLKNLEERTRQICQSATLDYQWKELQSFHFSPSRIGPCEPHVEYYANISMLRHFVNPKTQQLFSLQEIIIQSGLSKTKSLRVSEIVNPFIPGLIPEMFPGFIPGVLGINNPVSQREFGDWYKNTLEVRFYNILFDLSKYFKKQEIQSFDLWKGDDFQTDEVIAFFRQTYDTFKIEVLKKL